MGHWMVWLGENENENLEETEAATERCSLKINVPKSQKTRKCQHLALVKSLKNSLVTVHFWLSCRPTARSST